MINKMNELGYVHTVEYYTAMSMSDLLMHVTKMMSLQNTMLINKRNLAQKIGVHLCKK